MLMPLGVERAAGQHPCIRQTFASVLLVTIHEGRNRQVRRMFSAIGHEVVALKRVGFATIKLHDLPRGQWRRLTDVEVRKLKEL